MTRTIVRALVTTVSLSIAAPQMASAATIVYTNLAAFQAASATTNIDFAGLAANGSYEPYGTGPLTIGAVTFTSPQGRMYVVDADYGSHSFPNSVAPASLHDNERASGTAFQIALGGNRTAVGFHIANGHIESYNGGTLLVSLANGDSWTLASTSWPNFIGFTSDTPFGSLSISSKENPSGVDMVTLTNFRYGAAVAAVPEPASLSFLAFGLTTLGIAGYRHLRRVG